MRITDALLGEHAVIYPLLDELGRCDFETAGEARAQARVVAAALGSHARLEDELLFDPLEQHLGTGAGPLAMMRAEHDEIEALLARLVELEELAEARTAATQVTALAREHFAKEEQVLFPMADQTLDEAELGELGAEWARRRIP